MAYSELGKRHIFHYDYLLNRVSVQLPAKILHQLLYPSSSSIPHLHILTRQCCLHLIFKPEIQPLIPVLFPRHIISLILRPLL